MSLIYGIWSKHGKPIPNDWRNALWQAGMRDHISISWSDDRVYLQKIDIGAFAPGFQTTDTHITAVAGDPIMTTGIRDRADDMRAIDTHELDPLLKRSRGYFNLARYDRRTHALTLAVDRLGMRSLYVYDDGGEFVVFAGAMRIIEQLPGVTLTTDMTGLLQTAAFGSPLGERTRYLEVACLREGTVWRSGERSRYWEWQPQAVRTDVDTVMDEMYAAFQEAVRLRRGRATAVFASLSGGLDSRCGATELWRQGVAVTSLNVSWPGSYDDVLGRSYAKQLGLRHLFSPRALNDSGNTLAQHLWTLSGRATQIWAGNDGSVSLGHTRHTTGTIAKLLAGDKLGAAEEYLRASSITVSGKLLKGGWSKGADAVPLVGLLDELPDCDERSLWFFRIRNHHRRINAFHFEQIHMVPFEFIEPLSDPEVIALCAVLPMNFCLQHRMYHEWLKRFPPEIASVAWQSYPGHLPCPIASPAGYPQWSAPTRPSRSRLQSLKRAWQQFGRERSHFVSRHRVALAYLLYGLRLRDTSHLLRQAELIEAAEAHATRYLAESQVRLMMARLPTALVGSGSVMLGGG